MCINILLKESWKNMHSILDSMLNSKKIKYSILDSILQDINNTDYSETTLFIDLNSILSSFYQERNLDLYSTLNVNDKYIFCSQILNIAGHFRHYFCSRKRMYTNIYFIYSSKQPKYSKLTVSDYKKAESLKYDLKSPKYSTINNVLLNNIKIVELISKYIPHIYFINTGTIDTYIAPYHIISTKSQDENCNIIYTNNKQFNSYINDNTFVLSHRSDNSKLLGVNDVMDTLLTKKYKEDGFVINLDESYYNQVMAAAGNKLVGLTGIKGYGSITTIKKICSLLESNDPSVADEEYILNNILSEADKELYDDTLNILNLDIHYLNSIIELNNEVFIDQQVIDLIDAETLMYINNEYLNHYPIYLEYLFEGEEYE